MHAVENDRYGAAVALPFLQGWRVSEVLGLAWEDLDLVTGTARVRRAAVYVDGKGHQLGPPKTEGSGGLHWLMPTAVELLDRRRRIQADERTVARAWTETSYAGRAIDLVFTTNNGGLVARQTIAKLIKAAAAGTGIPTSLSTHTGRRSVVTTLFVDGGESLEDIARFVGHARPATTATYVKRLGRRPESVARRAAMILDGHRPQAGPDQTDVAPP